MAAPDGPQDPRALLLVLHGWTQSSLDAERITGFDAMTVSGRVIVVYPQGVLRSWNAGGCCEPASRVGVDDVGFLGAVIADVESRHSVDPGRIFVIGGSNGAEMAYRFACERADIVAAVAVVAGTMLVACEPVRPVSVIDLHGSEDRNIPPEGGPGCQAVACPSVAAVRAAWVAADRCVGDPRVVSEPRTATTTYEQCAEGVEVTFVSVLGQGHGWFTHDPDATATIWAFLQAHPREAATDE